MVHIPAVPAALTPEKESGSTLPLIDRSKTVTPFESLTII
jgi:hypothetical protein